MYERVNGSKRLATALKGLSLPQIEGLARFLNYRPCQLMEDIDASYRVAYGDPDPEKSENV